MSHTSGPWKISHSGFANAPFIVYTGETAPDYSQRYPLTGCEWIAEVKHDESPAHEEQKANARLIAAAPKLLESLEKLFAYIENGTLVRDVSKDQASGWAMAMVPFLRDLAMAQAAISQAKETVHTL